jgi:CheY-like chemotaxis protein
MESYIYTNNGVETSNAIVEAPPHFNAHVLIAEDSRLCAWVLSTHFRSLGYRVTTVRDGLALLEAAGSSSNSPDIIIVDYHMPVMDGEETVKKLKADPVTRHLPVLVLTGDLAAESLEKLIAAGADAYVEKNDGLSILQEKVSQFI